MKLPSLALCSRVSCGHLANNPEDGRALFHSLAVCISVFQENTCGKKRLKNKRKKKENFFGLYN